MLHRYKTNDADALLFAIPMSGCLVPLIYCVLAKKLKDWVSKIGLDGQSYTLHGLRRGGTNQAMTVGICGEDIQLMGDWKSQVYMEYIDLTVDRRVTNMVKFVDGVDAVLDECDWLKMEGTVNSL